MGSKQIPTERSARSGEFSGGEKEKRGRSTTIPPHGSLPVGGMGRDEVAGRKGAPGGPRRQGGCS
jgi:hypothetical protein